MAQAIVVGGGLAGVSAANTVLECGDLAAAALMIGSAMTNLPIYSQYIEQTWESCSSLTRIMNMNRGV